jgi:predicted permease
MSFLQDLKYGLRTLGKKPGFALLVILTVALGIGANTTIFSWINATLLNPVPGLRKANEVVSLTLSKPGENPFPFTYPDVEAMRDGQRSFTGIAACGFVPISLTGKGKPERLAAMVASANYFDVLGARPFLGRGFLPAEDEKPGGAPVAVISYRFWQTRFASDPNIVGRMIELNQRPYSIVGVTPAAFQGSQTGVRTDLWVPIMMEAQFNSLGDLLHDHHYFWLLAFGRLSPRVSLAQAQEEMTRLMKREADKYPEEHKGHTAVSVYQLWRNPFGLNFFMATLLPLLMCIASLVLLLACANVANLMLVRSVGRRQELAVRISLGASRWRLVRQLLVESLVLSLAGGAVALLFTQWTQGALMAFLPVTPDIPLSLTVETDSTVLLTTLCISVLTGVIFGILPAVRSSGISPAEVVKEEAGSLSGGLGKARLTSGLVVAQISLSLLLLVCAGLLIRSFRSAQEIDPGFNPHHVLIASYDLFPNGYTEATGTEFHRQVLAKLNVLPGIQSVALSNGGPLMFTSGSTAVKPEGYVSSPNESTETRVAIVSPNYLHTMQIPLVKGRDLAANDAKDSQPVAIVSEAFAKHYWPGQEAVGKRFNSDLTHQWFTVVGVARDCKEVSLNEKPMPFLYLPLFQIYRPEMIINVRTTGDPMAMAKTVEGAVHEINPGVLVFDETTVELRTQFASFAQRVAGTFIGAFGLLALALAAIGIYGVTSFTTRQRTHEIGIRFALGATGRDVLRLVLGQGLRLMIAGVCLGLALSYLLTRFLKILLLGVTSTDALTFSTVTLLLCAVALLACFIPARWAMRVEPIVALRHK